VQGQVHCYWVGTGSESFGDATTACANAGGYLVTIHSNEENAFVRALTTTEFFWIGMARASGNCSKASFNWITGEPKTVDLWESNEPDCNNSSPHAARMNSSGQWRDSSQSSSRAFVCEAGTLFSN
jgi:hypothetical protein